MFSCRSLTISNKSDSLKLDKIIRNKPGPHEVLVMVYFTGISRYDLHKINNDWGDSNYPLVPGMELIGIVNSIGSEVEKIDELDLVLVGNLVNSCKNCFNCLNNKENNCEKGAINIYDDKNKYINVPDYAKFTNGGFSQILTIDENFLIKVPDFKLGLELPRLVPLASSGLAIYSPLKKHFKIGNKVGILGFGGLGHLAVKIANEMGGDVNVFSTTESKRNIALYEFFVNSFFNVNSDDFSYEKNSYDIILDTIPEDHDISRYVDLLNENGKLILLGLPKEDVILRNSKFELGRKQIIKSYLGSMDELKELLNLCIDKGIYADVEIVNYDGVSNCLQNIANNNAKFKYIFDVTSLQLIPED